MLNILDIISRFIPSNKRDEIQDRIVDILGSASPNENWRKLIQIYRTDAAFRDELAKAIDRAVQSFVINYQDQDIVDAVTIDTHFWDIQSVQEALQEIITRPSSFLQQERQILLHTFADVLPTVEPKRVEQAVGFFLRCLTREVVNISQLAPIYQVQLQWASLEQSQQLIGLQRDQYQLMSQLVETVIQNQLLLAESIQPPIVADLPKVNDNLPSHGEFLGREKDIEQVLEGLQSRWPLISIEGMAGIGKTTLAIVTARKCLSGTQSVLDPPFKYVVWVSARDHLEQKLWLNDVLDTIARILGYPAITQLPTGQIEQKKANVHQLLRSACTLLIIDNFETIEDPALEIWIQNVPGPSKILITSRRDEMHSAFHIRLRGLEKSVAIELIRKHTQGRGRRLPSIKAASDQELLPLYEVTAGNPKAIELALGHMTQGLSLRDIVESLHAASKSIDDVFNYLFARTWTMMTGDARAVLQVMTFFTNPASKEALGATSGLTDFYLDKAIGELVELMLLEDQVEPTTSNYRYSIHPLTRAFARVQLLDASDFEKQARTRWYNYYLDFVRNCLREQPSEHYWNALVSDKLVRIDAEWPCIPEVLKWATREGQDQVIVDFVMCLIHYMDSRILNHDRMIYVRKAIEAAEKLDLKEDIALLKIDALGWTYMQENRFDEAIQVIQEGLEIAEQISGENKTQLIALGTAWQALAMMEQGRITEATQLINKALSIPCKPWIEFRVKLAAGDIAFKQGKNIEAINFYEEVVKANEKYPPPEGHGYQTEPRFGLAYLANGEIEKAEEIFRRLLDLDQIAIGKLYGEYGLALIAYKRGEKVQAELLVDEVKKELSRRFTSNLLLKLINKLFEDLEAEDRYLSSQ